MRRTQKQKREAAKRPKKKRVYFYKHQDGWTRFELDSEEQVDAWTSYCKTLEGAPTKADYEYFEKNLKNES